MDAGVGEQLAALVAALLAPENLEIVIRGIAQVILMSMSAFFSASEVALFSLGRLDLNRLESQRHPTYGSLKKMLKDPRGLIVSILCGNELVNIASSANMAALLLLFLTAEQTVWVNMIVMVPMLLLFGEVTPKTFAITFPVSVATKITARILPTWIWFVTPVRVAVQLVANAITTLIAGKPAPKENVLHTDEFRTLVEEGEAVGAIDPREKDLIDNMLEASEAEVVQIMTPCTRMNYIDAEKPMAQILEDFRRFRHPHTPVVRKHRNHVIGILEAEDVQRLLSKNTDMSKVNIEDILRPAHFVPPSKKVDEMFDFFKNNDTWAAIVLGEYGDVFGIVTIADVLGFVFGGISKKIDAIGSMSDKTNKNSYTVSGDTSMVAFNDASGIDIDIPEESVCVSLGGFVFNLLGRLPAKGDIIEDDGVQFTVLEMDSLRVKTLKVERIAPKQRSDTMEPVPDGDGNQDADEVAPASANSTHDDSTSETDADTDPATRKE